MPAAVCPACSICFPADDEYEFCPACSTATIVRAKTPHKDFKHRAFEAYWDLRELARKASLLEKAE